MIKEAFRVMVIVIAVAILAIMIWLKEKFKR